MHDHNNVLVSPIPNSNTHSSALPSGFAISSHSSQSPQSLLDLPSPQPTIQTITAQEQSSSTTVLVVPKFQPESL